MAKGMKDGFLDPEEPDPEVIKIHIEPNSFKISGKIPWERKHTYILLAILAAALGVSYEEIINAVGGV
tara:strand:+ start:916 stop:1119 length:204 start_codon:yes stop_codon:yes gene_type:complete